MATAAKSAPPEKPTASGQWSCTTLGAADALLHVDSQETMEAWLQHVVFAVCCLLFLLVGFVLTALTSVAREFVSM